MDAITWTLQAGTPHYASSCGRYVALYVRTSRRGFATYRVFRSSLPYSQRKERNALSVGGLPELAYWDRRELPGGM